MIFQLKIDLRKAFKAFLAVTVISSVTGTDTLNEASATTNTPEILSPVGNVSSQLLSKANNIFSVNLYSEIITPSENLITSPFSVASVLSMILLGSESLTASEIKETLGYGSFSTAEIEQAYKKSLTMIRASTECELSIANSIWIKDSYPVSESFKEKILFAFDAEECDFNETNGLLEINKWVSRKTNNKIPSLLSELPEDIVMLLLNAVYFKGPWQSEFNKELNEEGLFKNNDGNEFQQTIFMRSEHNYGYGKIRPLKAKMLDLPYKDENMSMIFILPGGNFSLTDTEAAILNNTDLFLNAIDGLEPTTVKVRLPKLSFSRGFDLVPALQRLGIQKVFTDSANLSGISSNLKLSKVFQKGNVDINEEGAETSAASAFLFSPRSLFVPKTKIFNANHPFMFLLYHKPTKTILFMGRYTKVEPLV